MGNRIFDIALPTQYKGRPIRYRQPFTMAADLVVPPETNGQVFADSSFYNALDMPFEVTAMIPNVTMLTSGGDPEPIPEEVGNLDDLFAYIRLYVSMVTSNTPVTFVSSRLSVLLEKDTLIWPFDAPIVLETRNGFKVAADNQLPADTGEDTNGGVRVELAFKGSLLALG